MTGKLIKQQLELFQIFEMDNKLMVNTVSNTESSISKSEFSIYPKPLCQFKNCLEQEHKVFCTKHLKTPVSSDIRLSDKVTISPTSFLKTVKLDTDFQVSNAMANALFVTSPYQIKRSKKSFSRLVAGLKKSRSHNNEFLEVVVLPQREPTFNASFYAPDAASAASEQVKNVNRCWSSTEDFLSVSQKAGKHQVFVCESSNEIIQFLPPIDHQDAVFPPKQNERLRLSLVNSLSKKADQTGGKERKRRKLEADKWIFWGRGVMKIKACETFPEHPTPVGNYFQLNDLPS